jgi:electron transfer flavoprotein alpha subunit
MGMRYFGSCAEVREHSDSVEIQMARWGGLAMETVHTSLGCVATVMPGLHTPGSVESFLKVDLVELDLEPSNDAAFVEERQPDAATMDLAEAKKIFGGGAGLTEESTFHQLGEVAAHLGASMGATRVVTDRGWVGHSRQIGTTGVVVDPDLYVSFGVSGAVQHTSGLGQPNHVISVNTDPHCPMMQIADLAIVSDANAVVAELEKRISESAVAQ